MMHANIESLQITLIADRAIVVNWGNMNKAEAVINNLLKFSS